MRIDLNVNLKLLFKLFIRRAQKCGLTECRLTLSALHILTHVTMYLDIMAYLNASLQPKSRIASWKDCFAADGLGECTLDTLSRSSRHGAPK